MAHATAQLRQNPSSPAPLIAEVERDLAKGFSSIPLADAKKIVALCKRKIDSLQEQLKGSEDLEMLQQNWRCLDTRVKIIETQQRRIQPVAALQTPIYTQLPRASEKPLVRVPFEIRGRDKELQAKAEKIFQLLYSKERFGSGKEVCSLILDAFTQLAVNSDPPITVSIAQLNAEDQPKNTMVCYFPFLRDLQIDSDLLRNVNVEDLTDRKLIMLMGTIIHEMTHAIDWAKYDSPEQASPENLHKEIGCTKEEFETALTEASTGLPDSRDDYDLALLCRSKGFPVSLLKIMRDHIFKEPRKLVLDGNFEEGFREYFARIPQMHCEFGRSESRAEIDGALQKIFPLGHKFFFERFLKKCAEIRSQPVGF